MYYPYILSRIYIQSYTGTTLLISHNTVRVIVTYSCIILYYNLYCFYTTIRIAYGELKNNVLNSEKSKLF